MKKKLTALKSPGLEIADVPALIATAAAAEVNGMAAPPVANSASFKAERGEGKGS